MLDWKNAFKSHHIAFGGAALSGEGGGYGFGGITENAAIDLVLQAYDGGIRVFDTAPIYGFGMSEERLGLALKKIREEVFVISKSGIDWDDKKNVAIRNDPKTTTKMLEQSLKTLAMDTIDLYMVHWPDPEVDIRHTLEVLVKAQEQGKIRYIGLCNTNTDELTKAREVAKVDVIQNQFHLFDRAAMQLFPLLKESDCGFMSWGTLDKGIITGSVGRNRKYDENDVRANAPWWSDDINMPKITVMEKILPMLEKDGHSGLELALSHNIQAFSQAQITALALCGARTHQQLQQLLKAQLLAPQKVQEIVNFVSNLGL